MDAGRCCVVSRTLTRVFFPRLPPPRSPPLASAVVLPFSPPFTCACLLDRGKVGQRRASAAARSVRAPSCKACKRMCVFFNGRYCRPYAKKSTFSPVLGCQTRASCSRRWVARCAAAEEGEEKGKKTEGSSAGRLLRCCEMCL